MPSLLEMQRGFAAALGDARAGPPRMAIYRGNVHGSRLGALGGAYPVLRRIVGEALFTALARDYGRLHPSTSGDLHEFGDRLAQFLGVHEATQDLPYLPEVARLEWLVHRAYYAADPLPFDPLRPTEVRAAPACALLASQWPAARIWQEHQERGDPSRVDLSAGGELALVHRQGRRVEVSVLRPGDFRFLALLQAGATLGAALEAAVREDPAFVPRSALANWVQAGVLAR